MILDEIEGFDIDEAFLKSKNSKFLSHRIV